MSVREYIGSRYVPIFGRKDEESITWDNTKPYEPLTIVLYEGNSYTSRQYVPAGIEISNQDYWAMTGNYNGQIEQYRSDVSLLQESIDGKPFVFNNVSEMKLSENIKEGDICHTNGFHEAGDGGAAWYVITSTGTANEKDVIACNTLFANLIIDSAFVTPEMFGCYGDNLHNDAECLQYAISNNYNVVGDNQYCIDSPILINSYKNVTLRYVKYTGLEYGIEIQGIYSNINIDVFRSTDGGFIKIAGTTDTSKIKINCKDVNARKQCFMFNATNATIVGIHINGRFVSTNAECALLKIDSDAVSGKFLTEVKFINSTLSGSNSYRAVISNSESNTNEIQFVMDGCNCENSTGIQLLGHTVGFAMINSRGNEIFYKSDWLNVDVDYALLKHIFIGNNQGILYIDKIVNFNVPIYINQHIVLNRVGNDVCGSGILYPGGYYIPDEQYLGYQTIVKDENLTDDAFTVAPVENLIPTYIYCQNTNAMTLNLPNLYYGKRKVQIITLRVLNDVNVTVKLINDSAQQIDTFTVSESGEYLVMIWYQTSTSALNYIKLN